MSDWVYSYWFKQHSQTMMTIVVLNYTCWISVSFFFISCQTLAKQNKFSYVFTHDCKYWYSAYCNSIIKIYKLNLIHETKSFIKKIEPVETNIVIFELDENHPSETFINEMTNKGIWLVGMGPQTVRIVTHLGIDEEQMEFLSSSLQSL